MKAAVAGKPGEVQIVDFPEPEVKDGEVLLESLACGVCTTDLKLVHKGSEKIEYALGHELVGKIIKAPGNARWKDGDRVAASPYLPCGQCYYCKRNQPTLCTDLYKNSIHPGGLAERVFVSAELAARGLHPVPDTLPDSIAALAEPLACAVKGVTDAQLTRGDCLLVIGDGPMGLLTAAAGRALGASRVVVAGMTPHRLQLAMENFADSTIDVSRIDLHDEIKNQTDGRGADVVIAAVSNAEVMEDAIQSVRAGGWVNAFAGVPEGTRVQLDLRLLHYKQIHLTGSFGSGPEHMKVALDLLGNGKVNGKAMVTATFPFEKVQEAIEYADNRKGLKAVVLFPQEGK